MGRAQILENMLYNPIRVLQHFVVPETDDTEALSFKPYRTSVISLRAHHRVLSAVNFDDQSSFEA